MMDLKKQTTLLFTNKICREVRRRRTSLYEGESREAGFPLIENFAYKKYLKKFNSSSNFFFQEGLYKRNVM